MHRLGIRNQKATKHDFACSKPRQNGKQRRHGERNRERGRVPKAVHCASQSKGKESRVRPNHTPSVPLPNLDHQTMEPTSTTVWRGQRQRNKREREFAIRKEPW